MLKTSSIVHRNILDTRERFWTTYKKAADEYDEEFLGKYNGDMDTSMIFVSPNLLVSLKL